MSLFSTRLASMLCFGLLLLGGSPLRCAWADDSREYLLKAGFIYNFARMTSWPEDAFDGADTPFNICFTGEQVFGEAALNTLRYKKGQKSKGHKEVHGHPVKVMEDVGSDAFAECHLLFISGSESGRLQEILEPLAKLPILTVGDSEGYAKQGCIINLVARQNTIRFEIHRGAATGAGLKISSRVLNIAIEVYE